MRKVLPYLSYYWLVIRRAWSDTWGFTKRQGLIAGTAAALLGSVVYSRIEDEMDLMPILVGGVVGLAVFTGIVVCGHLVLAPVRIHHEVRKELSDQAEQFKSYLRHSSAVAQKYGSNITHLPSLAAASRQIGTELRDIRHKIEVVRSTRPRPH